MFHQETKSSPKSSQTSISHFGVHEVFIFCCGMSGVRQTDNLRVLRLIVMCTCLRSQASHRTKIIILSCILSTLQSFAFNGSLVIECFEHSHWCVLHTRQMLINFFPQLIDRFTQTTKHILEQKYIWEYHMIMKKSIVNLASYPGSPPTKSLGTRLY